MLNCCIERRKAREASLYGDVSITDGGASAVKQSSQSDDDDDEFYECESDTAAATAACTAESQSSTVNENTASMQCDEADGWRDTDLGLTLDFAESLLYQADGRLKPCADLQLLNGNERLYVPVTQEPAPMTEDMLEEHAEVLARYNLC